MACAVIMDMAMVEDGVTADMAEVGVTDMALAMGTPLVPVMDLPITVITLATAVALRHMEPELQAIRALTPEVTLMPKVTR